MNSEAVYLRAVLSQLPSELCSQLQDLCSTSGTAESLVDTVIRFVVGADHHLGSSPDVSQQWNNKQIAFKAALKDLEQKSEAKRDREDVHDEAIERDSKRQRLSPEETDGAPLYTLHSVSANSPVRKKVDITVHEKVIKFTNSTTHATEATIPISLIQRAFILPTRGKSKPHWTVILMSSDVPDRAKGTNGASQDNPQIIFGIDATASSTFFTSSFTSPSPDALPKGSPTLPAIELFLFHVNVPVLKPTSAAFKSACIGSGSSAATDGIPSAEAYRAAKPGNLWFMHEGILWGEGKPCEFWAVEDLIGKTEGLRIVGGGGRTISVILTRSGNDDDEEDVGEETEFGMVDSREKEGITEWTRMHRHFFGQKNTREVEVQSAPQKGGPMTIANIEDDSDESDEDFAADPEEEHSGSSSELSDEEEEGGSNSETAESDADGEGDDDVEMKELRPEDHPLMKPGAMPRMSRAAIEMAIGLVTQDLMGGGSGDEEDELED